MSNTISVCYRFTKSVFVFLIRANVKLSLYLNPTPRERTTGDALIRMNHVDLPSPLSRRNTEVLISP